MCWYVKVCSCECVCAKKSWLREWKDGAGMPWIWVSHYFGVKERKETEENMQLEKMRSSLKWITQRGRLRHWQFEYCEWWIQGHKNPLFHHSARCFAQQSCRQLASAPDSECKQLTQSDRPLCVCDSNTGNRHTHTKAHTQWLHSRAPLQDCSPLITTLLTGRQTVPVSLSPTP